MYTEREVARIFDNAARMLGCTKEPGEAAADKSKPMGTNPMLERFTTYQLKAELRRRRREGSLFRWILWKVGL